MDLHRVEFQDRMDYHKHEELADGQIGQLAVDVVVGDLARLVLLRLVAGDAVHLQGGQMALARGLVQVLRHKVGWIQLCINFA